MLTVHYDFLMLLQYFDFAIYQIVPMRPFFSFRYLQSSTTSGFLCHFPHFFSFLRIIYFIKRSILFCRLVNVHLILFFYFWGLQFDLAYKWDISCYSLALSDFYKYPLRFDLLHSYFFPVFQLSSLRIFLRIRSLLIIWQCLIL